MTEEQKFVLKMAAFNYSHQQDKKSLEWLYHCVVNVPIGDVSEVMPQCNEFPDCPFCGSHRDSIMGSAIKAAL